MGRLDTALDLPQVATPAAPASGRNKIYPKSDDKVYLETPAGVEVLVGPAAAATANTSIQVRLPANVAITSTNAGAPNTITNLARTESVPGTSAVYEVTIDLTGAFTAATDCVLQLLADGVLQTGTPIFSAAAGRYGSISRTWTVTGLASGNRAFTARAYLLAAATVTLAQDHCVITVKRVS